MTGLAVWQSSKKGRLAAAAVILAAACSPAPSRAQQMQVALPGYGAGGPPSSSSAPPGAEAIAARVMATMPTYDAGSGDVVGRDGRVVVRPRGVHAPADAGRYAGNASATQPGFASAAPPDPGAVWRPTSRQPMLTLTPSTAVVAGDGVIELRVDLIGGYGPVMAHFEVSDQRFGPVAGGMLAWRPGESGQRSIIVPVHNGGVARQIDVTLVAERGATVAGNGSARVFVRPTQVPAWVSRPGCVVAAGRPCPVLQGSPMTAPAGPRPVPTRGSSSSASP